jgi:hypothetical protein
MDDRTLERFWNKVRMQEDCWLWVASTSTGYGDFYYRGRDVRAHRFSYELVHGPIPKGKLLCHTCDNTLCVNPSHMYVGDHRTNAVDAFLRGQNGSGEKHPNAKLTEAQVKEILQSRLSQKELSRIYSVSEQTINNVVHRKHYKEVSK